MEMLNYGRINRRKTLPLSVVVCIAGVAIFASTLHLGINFAHRIQTTLRNQETWAKCDSNFVPIGQLAFTDEPQQFLRLVGRRDYQASYLGTWHFFEYIGEPWTRDVRRPLGIIYLGRARDEHGNSGIVFLGFDTRTGDSLNDRLFEVYGTWMASSEALYSQQRSLCLRLCAKTQDHITFDYGRLNAGSTVDVSVMINSKKHNLTAKVVGGIVQVAVDGDSTHDSDGTHYWHIGAD